MPTRTPPPQRPPLPQSSSPKVTPPEPRPRRVGIVLSDAFEKHLTDAQCQAQGHPESPARLQAILDGLRRAELLHRLVPLPASEATDTTIRLAHAQEMIDQVEALDRAQGGLIDTDTLVSSGSARAARMAVGAAISAVDALMKGSIDAAFLPVRPPGHHATPTRSMGFCLYNNAAIAAAWGIEEHGLKRVAIVDWDLHHGNGTQEIFYERGDVFYVSLHQYPLYPGTGSAMEVGEGDGVRTTLNIPLSAGTTEESYLAKFRKEVVPALDRYEPQLLIVSCGFDAHENDPLGNLKLTANGFGVLTDAMREVAQRHAKGRLLVLLEGGYDLAALAQGAVAVVRSLLA